MSEILDDLNITSLKINDALNFGGKFVGSVQAAFQGTDNYETPTPVSTTTLITTLKLNGIDPKYISLASGTIGQMKIIVLTSGTGDEIRLNVLDYINDGVYFPFTNLTDNLTFIYTSNGWFKISGNVNESTYG